MNWERIIGDGMAGNGDDKQVALDRMEVKFKVCKQITCPGTGKVLDQARASVIESTVGGEVSYSSAYCSEHIEANIGPIEAIAKDTGTAVRVLDGRVLFGKGGK